MSHNQPFGSSTSRWFFAACILFVLYCAYLLVEPFLTSIFLAIVLVVVGGPVYDLMLKLTRQRRGLASALTCLLFILIIVVPLVLITGVITSQALDLYNTVSAMLAGNSLSEMFNSGMGRLGFSEAEALALPARLRQFPGLSLEVVFSHFSTADMPGEAEHVHAQAGSFARIVKGFRAAGIPAAACLANSAAILAYPRYALDAQRPGIAMYGANPFAGTAYEDKGRGLVPAMEVTAPVVSVRDLPAGASVSYGRTHVCSEATRVAVVAAGYADNYSRALSGRGQMNVKGVRAPILGRVCMQLTAIDVTAAPAVRPGDRVHLLGGPDPGRITAEDLAAWWGTIPYEVFCCLGMNPRQ